MTKITKRTITDLEIRLTEAQKDGDAKRAIFLKATINTYSKKLGLKAPYRW